MSQIEQSFTKEFSFAKRKHEAEMIRHKYPDRVPCVVERAPADKNKLPPLDKKKYLVPNDITFGQFIHVIRKRIKLTPEKALFLFVNNQIPGSSVFMNQIYSEYKDESGFLMITYASENTFGNNI